MLQVALTAYIATYFLECCEKPVVRKQGTTTVQYSTETLGHNVGNAVRCSTVPDCTALYSIVLHSTALYCVILHCLLHCAVCIVMYCTAGSYALTHHQKRVSQYFNNMFPAELLHNLADPFSTLRVHFLHTLKCFCTAVTKYCKALALLCSTVCYALYCIVLC